MLALSEGLKKDWPLWKQGPQPKLTAYEKKGNNRFTIYITQMGCQRVEEKC